MKHDRGNELELNTKLWVYLLLVLFYMENYSFLVLCNPSERTTGKWLQVWQMAQRQLKLWQLGLRAASPGWPGTSPGSASEPGQLLSQAQLRAQNEFRLLCWGVSGSGWWWRDAAPPPVSRGVVTVLGAAAALLGGFCFTLCVSIRAWRTHGSRTSLSPVVPRPVSWPVTLDFSWRCPQKYRTYSSKPCFQKKPNKVKETPCS